MLCNITVYPKELWKTQHSTVHRWWWWRRLSRVPWAARKSNQSVLKEINPEYSLEGLILKLKLQYSGHLKQKADLLEKILILGKIEGKRRRGQQRRRWLDSITYSVAMAEQTPGDSEGQGSLACCSPWGCKESDTTKPLNNNNKENQRNWSLISVIQKVDGFFWNKLKDEGSVYKSVLQAVLLSIYKNSFYRIVVRIKTNHTYA